MVKVYWLVVLANLRKSNQWVQRHWGNSTNRISLINYSVLLSFITIKVYDILGREVTTLVNEEKPAGRYEVKFDGSSLSSGVYFYRIEAGEYMSTKKLILLK